MQTSKRESHERGTTTPGEVRAALGKVRGAIEMYVKDRERGEPAEEPRDMALAALDTGLRDMASAYDCIFVAPALRFGTALRTQDREQGGDGRRRCARRAEGEFRITG